jgi:DNA adenine methylase
MDYITAQEAAEDWGITRRRVQVLCSENRIEGAKRLGNMWVIPREAKKPIDGRSLRYTIEDKK